MPAPKGSSDAPPHVPVLIGPLIEAVAPVRGIWLDGTLGAGGYTRALLEAGADKVIGLDRDTAALELVRPLAQAWPGRLVLKQGDFAQLDVHAGGPLDGVVLDLGVSSMQLDQAERGFSFSQDGPLDMRMGGDGPTAAEIVNTASEGMLADILYPYGEERAARRIARALVRARAEAPIERTMQLAAIVARCLPRAKPGQSHPATRSFQALRIAVNAELDALADGLAAAERALAPGGKLAVVSFHSLEDRIVKRFFQQRCARRRHVNRYAAEPEAQEDVMPFRLLLQKSVAPNAAELQRNPRARSARLRAALRTAVPAGPVDRDALGLPQLRRDERVHRRGGH